MSFERLHLLVTYLLVGTGFLVLFLSGEMPSIYWFIGIPCLIVSVPLGGHAALSSVSLWNSILIVALLGFGAAGIATAEWLHYAIYFTTVMIVAKLFQRHTASDIFQLYALSFLQLIAGAVINPTLSFAFCFVLYVVFLTWALVMLHLRRDQERLAAQGDEDDGFDEAAQNRVRRLIRPSFLAGTSGLALFIFCASIVVFLFFPRLGLGLFGQHKRGGTEVSGFSTQIELGHFGTLKKDNTIIMRVEVIDRDAQGVLPLRLRGISFNQFDGVGWSKSPSNKKNKRVFEPLRSETNGYRNIPNAGDVPEQGYELIQRIYLEQLQMGRRTVFGEHWMLGVRDLVNSKYVANPRNHTRFASDPDWDVVFYSRRSGALRYEVRSWRAQRNDALLRQKEKEYSGYFEQYVDLPTLNPEIYTLARQITRGKKTRLDQAVALQNYLMSEYTYSLEGGHDPEDPLSDFLFKRKSGHCEYFSTAFVVMARSLGIAARPVGGFFGGIYNEAGDYIQIRQADAHSWAEVYFPDYGWEVFDPTPPGSVLVDADQGLWARAKAYWDSLELLWYKWVIRWDLERQLDFFRGIGKRIPGMENLVPRTRSGTRRKWHRFKKSAKTYFPWAAGGAVLLGGLIYGFILWRRRSGGMLSSVKAGRGPDAKVARRLYLSLLKSAARRGVEITGSTTSGQVLEGLRFYSTDVARQAAPVVKLYEDVVFGGMPVDERRLKECRSCVEQLKKAS